MSNQKVTNLPLEIKNGTCFEICQSNPNTLTHSFFKYPCKFIPEIPGWAISKYLKNKDSIVYDPFCGSGTTLLESVAAGFNGVGSEIDPLAKLITRVKCRKLSEKQMHVLEKFIQNISRDELCGECKYIPDINDIYHWFSKDTVCKLGNLYVRIQNVDDLACKEFLLVCFASIIKKVSFCDNTSPKPYVSNRIKKEPADVVDSFKSISKAYLEKIDLLSDLNLGEISFTSGDALKSNLETNVDLAFTSPPYINAFDYSRTLRLENLWLNFETEQDIRENKQNYVGTEHIKKASLNNYDSIINYSQTLEKIISKLKPIDEKRAVVVLKFFFDMKENIVDVYNHLKPNCVYGIVIGDSEIRKILVPSAKIISEIASHFGFEEELCFSYIIKNPYIRIPRSGNGGQIKYDNVLILRRN